MYAIVNLKNNKVIVEVDDWEEACREARNMANTSGPKKVLKNGKELYRTGN